MTRIGLKADCFFLTSVFCNIVVLNTSDPILAFEALSGRRLSCRNEEAYLSFFSLTCSQYEDEMQRIDEACHIAVLRKSNRQCRFKRIFNTGSIQVFL